MLPRLIIRQDALERWEGKVDIVDAAILAAIAAMNPNSKQVRQQMRRGYFRLSTPYLLELVPLLNLSRWQVERRLLGLRELGLVELFISPSKGSGKSRYVRLSRSYRRALEASLSSQRAKKQESYPLSSERAKAMRDSGHFYARPLDKINDKDHYKEIPADQAENEAQTEGFVAPARIEPEAKPPAGPESSTPALGPAPPPCTNPAPYMDPEVVEGITHLAKRFNTEEPPLPQFPDNGEQEQDSAGNQ